MTNKTLLENYFSNQLNEKQLEAFEALYQSDMDFKKEVDFLKNLKAVAEKEDAEQFKATLSSFEEQNSLKNNFPRWMKVAASIAAVFVVAFALNFYFQSKVTDAELFATNFEPSKNVSFPIVRASSAENIQNDAFIAYNESNFEKAIPLLATVYAKTKESEILFYEGNALLASGKTQEAIDKFKQHLTFSDNLNNRTHWYLALAYLKNKETAKAKKELEQLLDSGEAFKKNEATSLLKKLK